MTNICFVKSRSDIIKNIEKLYEYLDSSDKNLYNFAFNCIKHGRAYVAYYDNNYNKWLLAPSRFVGYKTNNYKKHRKNDEKDGRKTCKKIDVILGHGYEENEKLDSVLMQLFKAPSYTKAKRHFWILGDKDKIDDKIIDKQIKEYEEQKEIRKHISYEGRISRKNREELIQELGITCQVCNRTMEEMYGQIGRGYIELHHLKPFCNLEVGGKRKLNSGDFAVLCPNCHRMIHKTKEIGDIEKFKQMINKNNFLVLNNCIEGIYYI